MKLVKGYLTMIYVDFRICVYNSDHVLISEKQKWIETCAQMICILSHLKQIITRPSMQFMHMMSVFKLLKQAYSN